MWYFDCGCSGHMTRNKKFLTNIVEEKRERYITLVSGATWCVARVRVLNDPCLPKMKKVMLVISFRANLLRISQICDTGLDVEFAKTWCKLSD